MSVSPDRLLQAFAEILTKRALLDVEHVPKLIRLALKAGVKDTATLRRWVETTPKLTNELRQEITKVLRPPQRERYGDFQVIGHLADGGMGDVWLAMNSHGKLGVIKTLLPEFHDDKEFIMRFKREVEITAGFQSPFLVHCLDHGLSDAQGDSLYITLEYVSGGDLHNLICARSKLGEAETLQIGHQIAMALDEASRLHLVHRDLKPENILISEGGDAKLVDFGLARTTTADRTVLTIAGSTLGTPDYMSPEQIYGEESLDIRSDMYALGCVMFFCLAGHPPFEGDSIDIMKNHISGQIPDIRRLNKQVSKDCRRLIERCMAKKPEDRYGSPRELAEECTSVMEKRGSRYNHTTMQHIKRSDMLPPVQFSSDSIMDLADVDFGEDVPDLNAQDIHYPPEPQNWLFIGHPQSGLQVHLFAKPSLLIGKLRAAPVDLCLRNYPKNIHSEINNRVSRQHAEIHRLPNGLGYTITDMGSTNGIVLDDKRIPAHTPWPLPDSGVCNAKIPKSVSCAFRCFGGSPAKGVIITRPENHPQIMYALVHGPITIGGEYCDLPLFPALSRHVHVTIRPSPTGWEWKDSHGDSWEVIQPEAPFGDQEMGLIARWGNYDDFT